MIYMYKAYCSVKLILFKNMVSVDFTNLLCRYVLTTCMPHLAAGRNSILVEFHDIMYIVIKLTFDCNISVMNDRWISLHVQLCFKLERKIYTICVQWEYVIYLNSILIYNFIFAWYIPGNSSYF